MMSDCKREAGERLFRDATFQTPSPCLIILHPTNPGSRGLHQLSLIPVFLLKANFKVHLHTRTSVHDRKSGAALLANCVYILEVSLGPIFYLSGTLFLIRGMDGVVFICIVSIGS